MRIALSFLFMLALSACGPEQTARDAERNEVDAMIADQKAQFDLLEGRYKGYITTLDGKKRPAVLDVHSWIKLTPIAGRAELMPIPSFVGWLTSDSQASLDWAFSEGIYLPKERLLKMIGQSSNTAYINFLNVKVEGDRLTGFFKAGKLKSSVEFIKVK